MQGAIKERMGPLVRQGFLGSEKAIGNVADKLANLYIKVDAFSQVHERINSDLNAPWERNLGRPVEYYARRWKDTEEAAARWKMISVAAR